MTTVAVVGATGRLGQQVVRVVESMDGFDVVAQLNSSSDLLELAGADLVIDVTRHDVSEKVISVARANGQAVLVGTSGWSASRLEALNITDDESVTVIPNFSVGSTVATHISGIVARFFPEARIDESHHVHKVDAPSGTSVRTAEVIAAERCCAPSHTEPAAGDSVVNQVPITSHRLPEVIAEQVVTFTGNGETITVGHETTSRDSYDEGIRAAVAYASTSHGLTVGLDVVMGIR
ncbi:MAG: 4-hydroxy-tetrahydrodipicolinate reductase [Microbacteriaceae bacterium]